ncbi:MFS transporter [Croceicoccus hydrothermalis]|uniref:MFS transporter n=1 Tax=Croceicoccus hydrothermalis TaxID=2867964 RepID=UPI001EFA7285|nr:MFS transporter [Croceicoccus hydrothermalis]
MATTAAPIATEDAAPSAAAEWRANWPLVLAATTGFSFYSVAIYATGLFIAPLSNEFGWSRTEITGGLSIAALVTAPFAPVVGAMIDRWGARRMALPGIVLTALGLASFGLVGSSVAMWLGLWVLYGFLSLSIKSTVWTAAVSGMFTAGRGLALAFTVSGVAVAQTVVPPLAQVLIDNFGWREAFFILAAGWGTLALVVNFFFLYDAHDRKHATAAQSENQVPAILTGLDYAKSFRDPDLIKIAISTFITMTLGVAILVHQVPILTEGGLTRTNAALLASLAGIGSIVGKLATGWLIDRFDPRWVSGLTVIAAGLGFFALIDEFRTAVLTVPAMVLIGYATGAKFQIAAYLTSKYGGMRNFGKIFGTLSVVIVLGSALGPLVAGAAYDLFGSYRWFLVTGVPGCLIGGFLLLRLGPVPDFENGDAVPN